MCKEQMWETAAFALGVLLGGLAFASVATSNGTVEEICKRHAHPDAVLSDGKCVVEVE